MRYLALDLGTKTCGVAISDKTNMLACPYKTIRFNNGDYELLFSELIEIFSKEKITHVIIGKPYNMDGTSGFATKRSKNLVDFLLQNNISHSFIDERLTSVFAGKILESNGLDNRKSKKLVDTVSACLILESYLRRLDLNGK